MEASKISALLADLLLVAHVAFVLFIVFGLVLIWVGGLLKWRVARSRAFRYTHLGAMGFVLLQTLFDRICPLTEWEASLRERAGQPAYGDETFIQYWLQELLYWDWPPMAFVLLYAVIFIAIGVSFMVVPVDTTTRGDPRRMTGRRGR